VVRCLHRQKAARRLRKAGIAGGADANFITSNLNEAVDANYPLIVGEFTVTGGVDPDTFDSTCLADGNIDYQTILQRTAEHQIGW
jgi:hypothetical protein